MKMGNRTHYWIFGLAPVLAVLVSSCGRTSHANIESASPSISARVVTAEVGAVPDEYEATGTIKALYNSTLSSKVMGRVVSVNAREGDKVKDGQLLVALDPRELEASVAMAEADYNSSLVGVGNAQTAQLMEVKTSAARIASARAQVDQAQASLAAARAKRDLVLAGPRPQEVNQSHLAVVNADSNLKLAKADLDRISKLVEVGALAKRELDVAQNRYDVAQGQYNIAVQSEIIAKEGSRSQEIRAAEQAVSEAAATLDQAKAALQQAQANSMQAEVRAGDLQSAKARVRQNSAAMTSARVALSYASVTAPFDGRVVGRFVDQGVMASPGTPLVTVEGGEYRLEASVPEDVISHVQIGSLVNVRIDALPDRSVTGRVAEIRPQANEDTHAFTIKIRLAEDAGVKSGMYGRAQIKVGEVKRILIPSEATWERDGLHYVYVVDQEDLARLRIITLGETTGLHVVVLSGLAPGERIIAGSPDNVVEGAQIEALS